MDYTTKYCCPLGNITLASDGAALVGLWFDGQQHFAESLSAQHVENRTLAVFDDTCRWLDIYFNGGIPHFTPKMHLRGSSFRKTVWQLLLSIPYGKTATYGELAQMLGYRSAQAVGGAIGHNPVSIIIPCHRIVGAGGKLIG